MLDKRIDEIIFFFKMIQLPYFSTNFKIWADDSSASTLYHKTVIWIISLSYRKSECWLFVRTKVSACYRIKRETNFFVFIQIKCRVTMSNEWSIFKFTLLHFWGKKKETNKKKEIPKVREFCGTENVSNPWSA